MRPKVKFHVFDEGFWSEENRKNSTIFVLGFRSSQFSNFPPTFSNLNSNFQGKSPDFSVAQAELPLSHLNCTISSSPLQFTDTTKTPSNSSLIKTSFCSSLFTSPFSFSNAPKISSPSLSFSATTPLPSSLACFAAWAFQPNILASTPSLPVVPKPPFAQPPVPSSCAARVSRALASFQPSHAPAQPPQSPVSPFPPPIAAAQPPIGLAQPSLNLRSSTQPSIGLAQPPLDLAQPSRASASPSQPSHAAAQPPLSLRSPTQPSISLAQPSLGLRPLTQPPLIATPDATRRGSSSAFPLSRPPLFFVYRWRFMASGGKLFALFFC